MKIGIIGTRGIPNQYGGFEQFATAFAEDAVKAGHEVHVYCSSLHPLKDMQYNGVQRVICYDPESWMGTSGQFIYDLNCMLHARNAQYDVILQLGYTSSSIWNFLIPQKIRLVTNMDGMEWKRAKYNKLTRIFLKYAESLAVKHSHLLIADSKGIADYLNTNYTAKTSYIPYGAEPVTQFDATIPASYGLIPFDYFLVIARMEPENNIQMILDGYLQSGSNSPLIVIGHLNAYGSQLNRTYQSAKIKFLGANYHQGELNALRHFASCYFHGHSVGGTNPSLLEAMASQVPIAAHNNPFNKAVLKEDGFYFNNASEVAQAMHTNFNRDEIITNHLKTLQSEFHPATIHQQLIEALRA